MSRKRNGNAVIFSLLIFVLEKKYKKPLFIYISKKDKGFVPAYLEAKNLAYEKKARLYNYQKDDITNSYNITQQ